MNMLDYSNNILMIVFGIFAFILLSKYFKYKEIQNIKEEQEEVKVAKNTVTKESIESKIFKKEFARVGVKTTVCCITMKNGFEVIGKSACVDPVNFDQELGEKYAYEDAFNQLWQLEGYVLQEKLCE